MPAVTTVVPVVWCQSTPARRPSPASVPRRCVCKITDWSGCGRKLRDEAEKTGRVQTDPQLPIRPERRKRQVRAADSRGNRVDEVLSVMYPLRLRHITKQSVEQIEEDRVIVVETTMSEDAAGAEATVRRIPVRVTARTSTVQVKVVTIATQSPSERIAGLRRYVALRHAWRARAGRRRIEAGCRGGATAPHHNR